MIKEINRHYRIRFLKVQGLFKKQDTTADKATIFQVFLNNKKQNEYTVLKNAIDFIIENEGQNKELENLIENLYYIQQPTALFLTAGIVYTSKHGIRIEQIFRE